MEAVRFALRSADALAATLNLRRTLNCVMDLAVPYFGSWAGLTVVDGQHLRRVDSAGADDFADSARPTRLRDLDTAAVDALEEAFTRPRVHAAPAPPAVLTALGVPPGSAEQLAAPNAHLVTVPLPMRGWGRVVLAVVGRGEPGGAGLDDFARRAATAITAAAAYDERATLAGTLREALVPAPLPVIPGVELGASYRPAQEATRIGGDFYDVTPRADGRWSLSMGDVCGKGVEAAVLTGQVRQSLRTAAVVSDEPATILRLVNDTLLGTHGTKFVTAAYAVLKRDDDGIHVRLAAGGHPPPLLLRGGMVRPVPVRGTLIGMLPDVSFDPVDLRLGPGDLLLFYTDGAPEARGASGLLGLEPIEALLGDCAELTAQAVTERVLQLVLEHLQGRPHDDIALMAVRCTADRPR
jgi:hypothetical protein